MPSLSVTWKRLIPALGVVLLMGCEKRGEGGAPMVADPWARPGVVEVRDDGSPTPANSAIYLTLLNPRSEPLTLLGGETAVAEAVELHESFLEGDVMRMREVGPLVVPANGEIQLRPGGLHLMLLGLERSLEVGDTLSLILSFQEHGDLEVQVPVRTMGGG
jgi:copper(I)-binding protein